MTTTAARYRIARITGGVGVWPASVTTNNMALALRIFATTVEAETWVARRA
jgi:hypothetical protein